MIQSGAGKELLCISLCLGGAHFPGDQQQSAMVPLLSKLLTEGISAPFVSQFLRHQDSHCLQRGMRGVPISSTQLQSQSNSLAPSRTVPSIPWAHNSKNRPLPLALFWSPCYLDHPGHEEHITHEPRLRNHCFSCSSNTKVTRQIHN